MIYSGALDTGRKKVFVDIGRNGGGVYLKIKERSAYGAPSVVLPAGPSELEGLRGMLDGALNAARTAEGGHTLATKRQRKMGRSETDAHASASTTITLGHASGIALARPNWGWDAACAVANVSQEGRQSRSWAEALALGSSDAGTHTLGYDRMHALSASTTPPPPPPPEGPAVFVAGLSWESTAAELEAFCALRLRKSVNTYPAARTGTAAAVLGVELLTNRSKKSGKRKERSVGCAVVRLRHDIDPILAASSIHGGLLGGRQLECRVERADRRGTGFQADKKRQRAQPQTGNTTLVAGTSAAAPEEARTAKVARQGASSSSISSTSRGSRGASEVSVKRNSSAGLSTTIVLPGTALLPATERTNAQSKASSIHNRHVADVSSEAGKKALPMNLPMHTPVAAVAPAETSALQPKRRGSTEREEADARRMPVAAPTEGSSTNLRAVHRSSSVRSQSSSRSRSQSRGTLDGEGGDDRPVLWESGDSVSDSASEAGDEASLNSRSDSPSPTATKTPNAATTPKAVHASAETTAHAHSKEGEEGAATTPRSLLAGRLLQQQQQQQQQGMQQLQSQQLHHRPTPPFTPQSPATGWVSTKTLKPANGRLLATAERARASSPMLQGSPTVASPLMNGGGPAAGGNAGSQRGVAAWMAAIVGGSTTSDASSAGSNNASRNNSADSVGRRGSRGSTDAPLNEGGSSTAAPILRSQSSPNMASTAPGRDMPPPPPRMPGTAAANIADTPALHSSVPAAGGVSDPDSSSRGSEEAPVLLDSRPANARVAVAASGLQALADSFAEEHASKGGPTRRLTTRLQTQAADQRRRREAEAARPPSGPSELKAVGAQLDHRDSGSDGSSSGTGASNDANGGSCEGIDADTVENLATMDVDGTAEASSSVAEAPLQSELDPPPPSLRILGHSKSISDGAVQFEVRFESAGEEPEDFWCDRAELAEGPHAAALKRYEAAHGLLGGVLV